MRCLARLWQAAGRDRVSDQDFFPSFAHSFPCGVASIRQSHRDTTRCILFLSPSSCCYALMCVGESASPALPASGQSVDTQADTGAQVEEIWPPAHIRPLSRRVSDGATFFSGCAPSPSRWSSNKPARTDMHPQTQDACTNGGERPRHGQTHGMPRITAERVANLECECAESHIDISASFLPPSLRW